MCGKGTEQEWRQHHVAVEAYHCLWLSWKLQLSRVDANCGFSLRSDDQEEVKFTQSCWAIGGGVWLVSSRIEHSSVLAYNP